MTDFTELPGLPDYGILGIVIAAMFGLYKWRKKVSDDKETTRELRDIEREKACQDLVKEVLSLYKQIEDRQQHSEETGSQILNTLTVLVERLTTAIGGIKEKIDDIRDRIKRE